MIVWGVLTGVLAYVVAVLVSVLLVFAVHRVSPVIGMGMVESDLARAGNPAEGLAMGAVVLGQAVLLRHAVYPVMAMMRNVLSRPFRLPEVAIGVLYSALFVLVVAAAAVFAVQFAAWMFTRLTPELDEREEIRRGNLAVAIYFALIVLSTTIVVNEGVEDLARSIIPYESAGIVQIE